MTRILIPYATMAGSTAGVAYALAEALQEHGLEADARPLSEEPSPQGYDAVIVGGPMIVGWHRGALAYVRRHRAAWATTPLALFALAISLTQPAETVVDGVPIVVDPRLPQPPARPGRLSLHERYAQLPRYVRPMLRAAGPVRPLSVALFGGRLELGRLPWWAVLFVLAAIKAPAGDRRNWEAIDDWAGQLVALLEAQEARNRVAA